MATTAPPVISDKPDDTMNGSFAPSRPDSPVNMEVIAFNVPRRDSLTFAIEGSDFFQVSGATAALLELVKSPFELPHHVPVFEWEEGDAEPLDIRSPAAVDQNQRVHVFVTAGIPEGGAAPGAFSGNLVVTGKSVSFSVPLTGLLIDVDSNMPIGQKYASLGGATFLGETVANPEPAPENNGSIQEFTNGALWDTGEGVFFISRTIYDKWTSASVQSGPGAAGETAVHTLGPPTEDTLPTAEGGQVLSFQGGSIIGLAGQAATVRFPGPVLLVNPDLVVVRDEIVINNDLNGKIQSRGSGAIRLIARKISHAQGVPLNSMGRDVVIIADEYDGNGAFIDARGVAGAAGQPGGKGQKGEADATTLGNRPGGVGGAGGEGAAGSTGGSVRLLCQRIVGAHVVANGGDGGAGGRGGQGGDGGDGRIVGHLDPELIDGTSGGNGGPGGKGGPGGRGGRAVAIFMDASDAPVLEVTGGQGGVGGPGGPRGVKGAKSPDDDSKPGAPGPAQPVGGAPGTAESIPVDADKYWGSVQAELQTGLEDSLPDWADHRLAVGEYLYRKDLLAQALGEFDAVLRLRPQDADAPRLKSQILLKQNILGMAIDLDLIPDFQEYINQFTSFKGDVDDDFNRGIAELLAAVQLDVLKQQVGLQVMAIQRMESDTSTELKSATDAQTAAEKQLQDAQAAVAQVSGQIRAALADMDNHTISFGQVLGTVGEIGGAVLSVAAAIPSGGTSLAALVPDVMALSDSLSENAGPIVDALFQPETTDPGGPDIDKIVGEFQNLNQDGKSFIQNSAVVNFTNLVQNLDHAETDNPQYAALVQRGAQVAHEQYLAERQKAQADQTVIALHDKLISLQNMETVAIKLQMVVSNDQKLIKAAGLQAIRSAQARVDSLLGFAFRAQRSLEISLVKSESGAVRMDSGYVHPDVESDFAEAPESNNDLIAAYTAAYSASWSSLLSPIVLQTEFDNYFKGPNRQIGIGAFSFTDPSILKAFQDTHDFSFSFVFEDLPKKEQFQATIQNVFVSFIGATSSVDFVPCAVGHSGRYEQKMADGTIVTQLLQPKFHNVEAATARLALDGVNFSASTTPLTASQGLAFWGRGVVGIWTVSIDEDEFRLKHVDLTKLSEIQVWVGYQYSA